MKREVEQPRDTIWRRIKMIQSISAGSRAQTMDPASLWTGARMILGLYPRRFKTDARMQDRILRAFVITVIPGAPNGHPHLVRIFHDSFYPFYPYTPYLVYDLQRRTMATFGTSDFDQLDQQQRTTVLEEALADDNTTARLVKGAILMVQVSFFAGIYDPEEGCPLIDFHGRKERWLSPEHSYPSPGLYIPEPATADGNPL